MKVHCAYDAIVDIDTLKPNPKNPNIHPQTQVEKLAKILHHFGWRVPITVSNQSGLMVRGHGRVEAARLAGLKEAPVDYQDYENNDLEMADLLADNKLSEGSELDDILSAEILEVLKGSGFDTELTALDVGEIDDLLSHLSDNSQDVMKNISRTTTQLAYVFHKEEYDRIMETLNRGKAYLKVNDLGEVLLRICEEQNKSLRSQ